jgi:hypothetical protein
MFTAMFNFCLMDFLSWNSKQVRKYYFVCRRNVFRPKSASFLCVSITVIGFGRFYFETLHFWCSGVTRGLKEVQVNSRALNKPRIQVLFLETFFYFDVWAVTMGHFVLYAHLRLANWVTRLIEFSPNGWLLTLKITEIPYIFGQGYALILTKHAFDYILGYFSQTHLVTLLANRKQLCS